MRFFLDYWVCGCVCLQIELDTAGQGLRLSAVHGHVYFGCILNPHPLRKLCSDFHDSSRVTLAALLIESIWVHRLVSKYTDIHRGLKALTPLLL